MAEEKTVLIIGGVAVGVIVLLAVLKRAQDNTVAALNQPGLISQPSIPAPVATGLGSILNAAARPIGSFLQNIADSGSVAGLNDPGLEYSDATAYPDPNYTYDNSNSYASTYDTPFPSANDVGYSDPLSTGF